MDAITKIKLTRNTLDILSAELVQFISEHLQFFEISDSVIGDYLYFDAEVKRLKYHTENLGDLYFNFEEELNYHRHKNYSLTKEPLAKSLGLKGNKETIVWDATCGTAKDSLLISHFGARVFAFERHPLIYLLLVDAKRAYPVAIIFIFGDSLGFSDMNIPKPDVIYYDPMYPEKKKSALPRKEMQIFKTVIGPDDDSEKFLAEALKIAIDRVVVKRSIHAPKIYENTSASYIGKSTRYDMYKIFSQQPI